MTDVEKVEVLGACFAFVLVKSAQGSEPLGKVFVALEGMSRRDGQEGVRELGVVSKQFRKACLTNLSAFYDEMTDLVNKGKAVNCCLFQPY